jgi:hypothetical protein
VNFIPARGHDFSHPVATIREGERRSIRNAGLGIDGGNGAADDAGCECVAADVALEVHVHVRTWTQRLTAFDECAARAQVEQLEVIPATNAGAEPWRRPAVVLAAVAIAMPGH